MTRCALHFYSLVLRKVLTNTRRSVFQIPDAVTAHYLTLSGLPPPSPQDPTGVTTNTTPLPLARLLALATQKFIADIAADAYQYSRIRSSNSAAANNPLGGVGVGIPGQPTGGALGGGLSGGKGGQTTQLGVQRAGFGGGGQGGSGPGRTVLTMEDLGMAVGEYGVNVKRSEFYR
jgi:transcription initiation factor TFIID subunit 10